MPPQEFLEVLKPNFFGQKDSSHGPGKRVIPLSFNSYSFWRLSKRHVCKELDSLDKQILDSALHSQNFVGQAVQSALRIAQTQNKSLRDKAYKPCKMLGGMEGFPMWQKGYYQNLIISPIHLTAQTARRVELWKHHEQKDSWKLNPLTGNRTDIFFTGRNKRFGLHRIGVCAIWIIDLGCVKWLYTCD